MRAGRSGVVAAAVLGAGLAGGTTFALTGPGPSPGAGRGPVTVILTARHSRFSPARLSVPAGTAIRFVVRNEDPISHELIVGGRAVHERHERGTEAVHAAVPGEVSFGPGETAETTLVFDRPGPVAFGCHLPGHWAYGMRGEVTVENLTLDQDREIRANGRGSPGRTSPPGSPR